METGSLFPVLLGCLGEAHIPLSFLLRGSLPVRQVTSHSEAMGANAESWVSPSGRLMARALRTQKDQRSQETEFLWSAVPFWCPKFSLL